MRQFKRRPRRPCRVHNQPDHGRVAGPTPQAASEPLADGRCFFELLPVPELRNLVYEAFFKSYKQENATGDCTCSCHIGDFDFQQLANHDSAQSIFDGSSGTKDDPTWQGFKAELSMLVFEALVSRSGTEICGIGTCSTLHSGSQWTTVKFELMIEGQSGFSIGPWNLASLDWSSISGDRRLLVDEVDAQDVGQRCDFWADDGRL